MLLVDTDVSGEYVTYLQGSELYALVTLNSLKLTNNEEPPPESRFAPPRLRYRQSPVCRPENV